MFLKTRKAFFSRDRLSFLSLRHPTSSRLSHQAHHGAGKVHQFLHRSGHLFGHRGPPPAPHRDLCSAALLGLFCSLWAAAHLPQPGSVDILVPRESHCVGGGAQPPQTGHIVMTLDGPSLDEGRLGQIGVALKACHLTMRRGRMDHNECHLPAASLQDV